MAICLTETWLKNSSESDCFSLQNYLKMETSNRKKRGGCVGIFVHKKTTKKRIASVETNSLQAISLEIKFCDKTHLLTCVYIPPNATKAETFEKFSSYFDQISITPSTLLFVCGDLNVNFLKKSAKSTLIINQMEMNSLALVDPQSTTRETIRTKTCIDVFVTNFKSKSFIEKTRISDHYTAGLELIKREKSSESVQILRRNWNKLDDDHLLIELNCFLQKKFESVSGQLLTSDTNRCAEIVHEKLVEALNIFLPLKPSK